jgi:hypothetical protein
VYLLIGHTLYLIFRGLLGLESSYQLRNKEEWWARVLRTLSIVLYSNCLRVGHYNFLMKCKVNPLRGREDTPATYWGCGGAFPLEKTTPQGLSTSPHSKIPDPISSQLMENK